MVKASAKASVKAKKEQIKTSSHSVKADDEEATVTAKVDQPEEKKLSEITISIESCQNIQSAYPSSNIFVKCHYMDKELGKTNEKILTDDPVTIFGQDFKFHCDVYSTKEIDDLISSPVNITVHQVPFTHPESKALPLESNKPDEEKLPSEKSISSIESVISLYESLTGDPVEIIETLPKNERKSKLKQKANKNRKGNKGSDNKLSRQSSKESKKSKKSQDKGSSKSLKKEHSKEAVIKSKTEESEMLVGSCSIDLLPLVFGKTTFTEFTPLILAQTFCDDRMFRYKYKPGIVITISIDEPLEFSCKPVILNVTLESIFNIPSMMNEDMECHTCIMLPFMNLSKEPLLIKNGALVVNAVKSRLHKQWPEVQQNYSNLTHYMLNEDTDSIKNYVNVNLHEIFCQEKPRIQFNCVKRNVLLKEGFFALYDHLRKYQRVILEIYVTKKAPINQKNNGSATGRTKLNKAKTKEKSESDIATNEDKKVKQPYLHLMAVVDLSTLLYPGISKVRIATPLTTYHEKEAMLLGGLEKSYFLPPESKKQDQIRQDSKTKTVKKGEKKTKDGKSSKASSKKQKSAKASKSTKGSKKGKDKKKEQSEEKDLNMKNALPPEPVPRPPPEPSIKVYNEAGEPTFIILEIELTQPFVEKKTIDDLHKNLQEMVHEKPHTPKIFLDTELVAEYYNNILREMMTDINEKYATFTEARKHCHCENKGDFLIYLRRIGAYQNFVAALIQIASLLAQNKLNIIDENQNQQQYQRVIEEIFMQLSTEINQVLHKVAAMDANIVSNPNNSADALLFYAKEMTETMNLELAERYYLERLYFSFNNPDYWFDYAVFKLECGYSEKAFMCLREALSRKMYHRNSLLMSGILLAEKKQLKEAELYLLTLMVQEPRWVEGWVVLYLFYKNMDDVGGMDLSQEMALKYLNDPRSSSDDFMKKEDLAWTASLCPNTLYFRAAVILLKMRIYSWAEAALAYELKKQGIVHYMLAAICYYERKYEHALQHLERAKYFHGSVNKLDLVENKLLKKYTGYYKCFQHRSVPWKFAVYNSGVPILPLEDYAVVSLTGHCHLALGNTKEAQQEYLYILEAFEKRENMHLVYINFAKVTDDPQKARKLLLTACKHNPTPYCWMSCGITYFKLNDLTSAEECFSEAVILDNSLPECWGYLTLINLKLKRTAEADICYALALKNNLKNEYLLQEIKNEFEKFAHV